MLFLVLLWEIFFAFVWPFVLVDFVVVFASVVFQGGYSKSQLIFFLGLGIVRDLLSVQVLGLTSMSFLAALVAMELLGSLFNFKGGENKYLAIAFYLVSYYLIQKVLVYIFYSEFSLVSIFGWFVLNFFIAIVFYRFFGLRESQNSYVV